MKKTSIFALLAVLMAAGLACGQGSGPSPTREPTPRPDLSTGYTLAYIGSSPAVIFDIADGLQLRYHDFTSEKTADGYTWYVTGYTVTADRGDGSRVQMRFFDLQQTQAGPPSTAYRVEVDGVEMQGPAYADFKAGNLGPGLGLFFTAPGLAVPYLKVPCDDAGQQSIDYGYAMPASFMQKFIKSIVMACSDPHGEYQVLFSNYTYEARVMGNGNQMGVIQSVEVSLVIK